MQTSTVPVLEFWCRSDEVEISPAGLQGGRHHVSKRVIVG